MGITSRIYLFPEDGSLRRVSQRVADKMPFGGDAILEFAGTKQRVAQVVIENDDRRPLRILDARGIYWNFNDEGRIDEDFRERFVEFMEAGATAARAKRATVVDLVPEIKKRELQARTEWTLTAEDLDRIAADLWPGIHGPAPDVSPVKGKRLRKPPLTNEARWAMERIETHVSSIRHELSGLSERALKGLAFEGQRLGLWEEEMLWRGISDECKRLEAIRAAHRTGHGEWYAVIEVARPIADKPNLIEQVAVLHTKCATRSDAIETGRLMMADRSGWLDAGTEIEVSIRSALEWRPEEWGTPS